MDVTLREYIERILDEREKAALAHLIATEKTLKASEIALNSRLEGMNEFRAQLDKERDSYASQESFCSLEARVDKIEQSHARQAGFIAAIVLFGGVILGIAVTLYNISGLTKFLRME